MDIKQAKEVLRRTFLAYTERDADGALCIPALRQRPLLLIGPPGIGKTAILSQLAEELGAGNIDADPCVRGPQESACDHCAFASACWFDERRDKAQYLQKTTPEEFWAVVDREVSHG